jgi:hypothetical protein
MTSPHRCVVRCCRRCLWAMVVGSALAFPARAQDLTHLSQQKPFTITGNVGGGYTFFTSNQTAYASVQPPYSWNLYGNFTASIYSVSLPFSFVINQYGNSYTSPFSQFGISPTYKWIKLDLGYRYIEMSPFTFSGQSFLGVGLELNPGIFRFAAFYGSLNKAISEDTTSGHLAMPQYGRIGYGVKLGVGTEANHLDLIYFHARDDSSSIHLFNSNDTLRPQENTVLGLSMKFTFFKKLVWKTDLAASALTQDLAASVASTDTLNKFLPKVFSHLTNFLNSTQTGAAMQSQLSLVLKNFNTSFLYRRVQPDFMSLGVPYILSDLQNWQWNGGVTFGKLNINVNLNDQSNNISQQDASTLHTFTGTLALGGSLSQHVAIAATFTAVNMQQSAGTPPVSDSALLNQRVYNASLTPIFIFGSPTSILQTLTPSLSYSLLQDNNPYMAPGDEGSTLTGNLSYTCQFVKQAWSLTGSFLYNRYSQDTSLYTSYGINVGGSAQLLKGKILGVQATIGYLINQYSQGNAGDNVTGSFNIRYALKKKHSFSAYFNYVVTPPNNLGLKVPYAVNTTNVGGGVSYNYSF